MSKEITIFVARKIPVGDICGECSFHRFSLGFQRECLYSCKCFYDMLKHNKQLDITYKCKECLAVKNNTKLKRDERNRKCTIINEEEDK